MIIKLTECRHNNGVEKANFDIWVNMDHFITMNRSIKGRDTHIKLSGAFLFVKETPEEIMRIMGPPIALFDEASDVNEKMWNSLPGQLVRYGK